jgi:hypothetical protein
MLMTVVRDGCANATDNPKEGLGVRLTPGFSEMRSGASVNRSTIVLLVAALALGGEAAAQTMQQPDPAAPQTIPDSVTAPESATSGIGRGDYVAERPTEGRSADDGNNPPADPPARDETVGVGGSVDRAPRDIREPFDE